MAGRRSFCVTFLGSLQIHPNTPAPDSAIGMWNVEERFTPLTLESLPKAGFTVGSTRGVMRVEKYGCGAEFRRTPDGHYQLTILPTILLSSRHPIPATGQSYAALGCDVDRLIRRGTRTRLGHRPRDDSFAVGRKY